MGSFFNFKNFGDTQQQDGSGGNELLGRQSSIYSLTFDELQGTFSGVGKDFGSMNMEDLLKNIWTAEESQALASSAGNLQRQGSLTLPPILSHKTVDQVWRDTYKQSSTGTNGGDGAGGSRFGPRQNTLGETTLEEFLLRAGAAREDPQQSVNPNVSGFYGTNSFGNQFLEHSNPVPNSSNMMLNLNGTDVSRQNQVKDVHSQHQSLFSNEASVTLSSGVPRGNNNYQISSPQRKVPVVSMPNSSLNSTLVQDSGVREGGPGLAGLCNLPASHVAISHGNHIASSTAIAERKLDIPPVSSLYTVGEGGRGRRANGSIEKVVERRRKRMIKNRESAARSRERKQAYTLELEAEVANLKEINQELQKKQAEFMEMQKDQILETRKMPWGGKRRGLMRTLTGPW